MNFLRKNRTFKVYLQRKLLVEPVGKTDFLVDIRQKMCYNLVTLIWENQHHD